MEPKYEGDKQLTPKKMHNYELIVQNSVAMAIIRPIEKITTTP